MAELNNIDAKDTAKKRKRGGAMPGAGRKPKAEEFKLIEQLKPYNSLALNLLAEKLKAKDMKALQLYMAYFYGAPTQKIENKIEGNLNQINVEVRKPEQTTLEKVA